MPAPESAIAQRRDDLERFEFMMGAERGRLAVTLDMLTDRFDPDRPARGVLCFHAQSIQACARSGSCVERNRRRQRADSVGDGATAAEERESDAALTSQLPVLLYPVTCAPVAQLDRANASGALGREFESLRAHHASPPLHIPAAKETCAVVRFAVYNL